jgi:hypothetical protein
VTTVPLLPSLRTQGSQEGIEGQAASRWFDLH